MRRVLGFICAIIVVLFSVTKGYALSATAAEAIPIGSEGIVDSLADKKDKKLYSFSMDEPGDAVVLIQSLQKSWSGYTYYWHADVIDRDGQNILKKADVSGGDRVTVIALNNLEGGTYHVSIGCPASSNPLMAGFSGDEYRVLIKRFYNDTEVSFSGKGVMTFKKSGDLLGQIDGTYFLKLNDGEAYSAFYKNENGAIVPVLIGETKESVEFLVSSSGEIATAASLTFKYDGKEYYCSYSDNIDSYTDRLNTEADAPYYFSNAEEKICNRIIKDILRQKEREDKGAVWFYISNYWIHALVVVGIALILVIVFKIVAAQKRNDEDR